MTDKPMTPEELISYIRKAEPPFLSLSQEQLIIEIRQKIAPTLTALFAMTMQHATTTRSIKDESEMAPYLHLSTEFKNKIDAITKDLPAGITRAFGAGLLQQVFEEHFGKGEDEEKEMALRIWVGGMLEVWRMDKRRYGKWNI